MSEHINAETDSRVPEWALHTEDKVCGFFGPYRFLSNFWPCDVGIWWNGRRFLSVENAYQAAKFPSKYQTEFVDISASMSKKLAKAMVKEDPTLFNKESWNAARLFVMANLIFQKFNFDVTLHQQLLDTGNRYLEETNSWWDVYWGVCQGKGENNLGKILMQTRAFWNGL